MERLTLSGNRGKVTAVIVPLESDPQSAPLDVVRAIAEQHRQPPADRPYVLTNMVASADGGTAVDGRSGDLGGPADREMFAALRGVADVIVAGAATVRAERYGPPRPTSRVRRLRGERQQAERPELAVVTASGRLDPDLPMFTDPDCTPIVICGAGADEGALAAIGTRAEIERSTRDTVSPGEVLSILAGRGHHIVLVEGGPTLNGQFLAADCIDEWNLTISPLLVAGSSRRPSTGPDAVSRRLVPTHVWRGDDLLFVQWRRPDSGP